MKNFKKVISVVMALAMIISSFTAVSASKFADVADTANYAEAVEVLEALGVVSGVEQENGTFNFEPEKLVTRAEAATMIVGALNMAADAQASAATSQFGDVNSQAAWAAGFVNVGVAQGFIAGYDATTFGPLDNVTYAQLCVMLTQITGYGDYAKAYGGWPTGYTTMAATAGINKGVAVASDAALTKGQVAMMIWNALQAPMLGVSEYAIDGNKYKPQNGKNGTEYKTLFTEKFDGFTATNVTITATPNTLNTDENVADLEVFTSDWWLPTETIINETDGTGIAQPAIEFNPIVDVNGNLLQTGKAVFVLDENDLPLMIYFKAGSRAASRKFAADTYYKQSNLVDDKQYASAHTKIRFGSSYFKFENSIDLYVNGVFAKTINADADIAGTALTGAQTDLDWVLGNAQGDITILKSVSTGEYDTIFVKFYQIGEVASVESDSDETVIELNNVQSELGLSGYTYDEIVISKEAVEEGKVTVTVTRNGEVATLDSLVNGDIIAYATAFDVTANKIEDPKEIEIIATNDTVSGSVTSVATNIRTDYNDNVYTIGGANYVFIPSASRNTDPAIAVKDSLDITLDPFGRIYEVETNADSANYAIALKLGQEDNFIKLLLSDGTTKTYEVDTAKVGSTYYQNTFVTDRINDEVNVADRIVTYEVSGKTGKITSLAKTAGRPISAEYKTRTGLLGSGNKILSTTPMIVIDSDAEGTTLSNDASKYAALTKDELLNETTYDGIVFRINTTVAFVVITNVGTAFAEDSRFAVAIAEPADVLTEDGDSVKSVKVLYDGDVQDLYFAKNGALCAADNITAGDIFFFETNSDGFVDEVYEYVADETAPSNSYPTGTLWNNMIDSADWSYVLWDTNRTIQLVKGIVTEVTSSGISFARYDQVATGSLDTTLDLDDTNTDGIVTYGFADDCVAYTYDADMQTRVEEDKYDKTSASSIKASNFAALDSGNGQLNDGIYVESNAGDMMARATEATAMIVDGEIVAIFAIEK